MAALRASLHCPDDIDWSSSDYCTWTELDCDKNSRVQAYGSRTKDSQVPEFKINNGTPVIDTKGNSEIGTDISPRVPSRKGNKNIKILVGSLTASLVVALLVVAGFIVYLVYKMKKDLVQSSEHNEIEMVEHNEINITEHNEIEMAEHNEIIENKAIAIH
ncbi:hypothetical protein YC2023_032701 [Brassica napus]|uniref:(rape) hypothetical protein n=1 Tax=Brassica napus TaxID=3708 RepID=A0A816W4V6_BRANA|nr:unnamed protein product [Brassica napus]